MHKLLVIDDDPAGCRLLKAIFAPQGFDVRVSHSGEEGVSMARDVEPDVVLLDLRLPGIDGMEVLFQLRAENASRPVIMMSAHGEVRDAVRATQLGAFDYLVKPIDPDEIGILVSRALETRALRREVEVLRRQIGSGTELTELMGNSPPISAVVEQVATVAATPFSVLVLGETGTGKELVARAIHRQSERRAAPFVALDCGAIPEALLESELFGHERGAFTGAERRKAGQFHLAQEGTLFLDEIGNLPLALQAKMLRVLESRQVLSVGGTVAAPVNVRFVAATNEDLQDRASNGRFRADLYFRLAQYTIRVPPLRERASDIAGLARRFASEASVELRKPVNEIAPEALAALERHSWPGNVRELRNVVRRAVLDSTDLTIRRAGVQRLLAATRAERASNATTTQGASLREVAESAAREAERQLISATLRATKGNKAQAARAMQTDYKTLHLKMKALGLRARDFMA